MKKPPATSIRVLREGGASPTLEPLSIAPGAACTVELKGLPGTTALHVPIIQDGQVVLRVEIPYGPGDAVKLRVGIDREGRLTARAVGRQYLTLPGDGQHEPLPVLMSRPTDALDVVILVDGTATLRTARDSATSPPLLSTPRWTDHINELGALVDALRDRYPSLRAAVIAFGDDPLDHVQASDLAYAYTLYPARQDSRRLRTLTPPQIAQALLTIPAANGSDFVDALADGLDACRLVEWRGDARKVLILTGDSPGFSVTHPSPADADAHVRIRDVDEAALALRGLGVEMLTIYHEADARAVPYEIEDPGPYIFFASEQYKRLASHPGIALCLREFDAARVARALVDDMPEVLAPPVSLAVMVGEARPDPLP